MAEAGPGELRYKAFLSYSHKDATVAARLHRRLETYRLPRRLVGSEGLRGPVPERLWPIFRDREELPAASDLSETVRAALAESASLIVVCSPHAAASLWVAEEIETFRRLYPERPILAAIVDGEPGECFPAALRAFGQDGTWHEPLATDLRPQGDGPHLGLLKLVAGITGVGLDALVQRDAQRKVRRVTAVTVTALLALLLMTGLTVFALDARAEAERQRAEAEGLIEFMLTDLRERLNSVGRVDVMDTVNRRALAYYNDLERRRDPHANSAMRARVIDAVGEVQMNLGDMEGALESFQEAHRTTSLLMAQDPDDPDTLFAHGQAEYWLGFHAYAQGDLTHARPHFERYQALAERLLTIDPANVTWLREAAYVEGNLCVMDMDEEAAPSVMLRRCMLSTRRMEQVRNQRPNDPTVIRDVANRYGFMVDAWAANGRWNRALAYRVRHEALIARLIQTEPNNLDYRDIWMRSQFGFGELLARRGENDEAQRRFRDAADAAELLMQRDPNNATWRNWYRRISSAITRGG